MYKKVSSTVSVISVLAGGLLLTGCSSPNPNPTPTAVIPTINVKPQTQAPQTVPKMDELLTYVDSSIIAMNDLGLSEVGKVDNQGYKAVVTKYNGKITGVTYFTDSNTYKVYYENDFKNYIMLYTMRDLFKTGFDATMSSEGVYHVVAKTGGEEYWVYVREGKIVGVEGGKAGAAQLALQLNYGLNDNDKALFMAGINSLKEQTGTNSGKDVIPQ